MSIHCVCRLCSLFLFIYRFNFQNGQRKKKNPKKTVEVSAFILTQAIYDAKWIVQSFFSQIFAIFSSFFSRLLETWWLHSLSPLLCQTKWTEYFAQSSNCHGDWAKWMQRQRKKAHKTKWMKRNGKTDFGEFPPSARVLSFWLILNQPLTTSTATTSFQIQPRI